MLLYTAILEQYTVLNIHFKIVHPKSFLVIDENFYEDYGHLINFPRLLQW